MIDFAEKPTITKVGMKEFEPVFKRDGKKWLIVSTSYS